MPNLTKKQFSAHCVFAGSVAHHFDPENDQLASPDCPHTLTTLVSASHGYDYDGYRPAIGSRSYDADEQHAHATGKYFRSLVFLCLDCGERIESIKQ